MEGRDKGDSEKEQKVPNPLDRNFSEKSRFLACTCPNCREGGQFYLLLFRAFRDRYIPINNLREH